MNTLHTSSLIFSCYKADAFAHVNQSNFQSMLVTLRAKGIEYKILRGSYKGIQEWSVLVSSSHRDNVEIECFKYTQESYLELYGDKFAELVLPKYSFLVPDERIKLGYMSKITEAEASLLDAWSCDPMTGQYYGVKS